MKAIFLTDLLNGVPVLPPFEDESGYRLYFHDGGVLHGGYSMVGEPEGDRVRVQVEASAETIGKMKADPRFEWVEDVEGEQ